MTVDEFQSLKRAMKERERSILTAEYERRIVVADLGRIDMAIATDNAFIASGQAEIDLHWQHTFASDRVTA